MALRVQLAMLPAIDVQELDQQHAALVKLAIRMYQEIASKIVCLENTRVGLFVRTAMLLAMAVGAGPTACSAC